jgi:hypothetical protein
VLDRPATGWNRHVDGEAVRARDARSQDSRATGRIDRSARAPDVPRSRAASMVNRANPISLIFIAFSACLGARLGSWLWRPNSGLGVVLVISLFTTDEPWWRL